MANNENSRFSDERLAEFYAKFSEHIKKYEQKSDDDAKQLRELIEATNQNSRAILSLVEETRGIVQLHNDIQSAARLGTSLQKFGIWLTKWGVIGAGLAAAYQWAAKHMMEWFR